MSLNSVNTNMGAMVALQSLESTNSALASTQKQISTGYRVADASDDGAAFAIAQGIRSQTNGLNSANQQLGNVTGLLDTTQTALTGISKLMTSMRGTLTQLAGSNVTSTDQTNFKATLTADIANIKSFISGASYNGKSLIGASTDVPAAGSVSVAQDGSGNTYQISSQGMGAVFAALSTLTASLTSTTAKAALTATGALTAQETTTNTALNTVGTNINYVGNQTTFNNNKIDALNSGLGSLIDADLAKESAQLTALQIRQQLGTQSLSMANQAPQSLMSLFK